jgi:recombinational DNA repair protein (RecF pathway)
VPIIDDEALVLDHHPYRDRHLILAVLTRRSGVQRGVLRQARGGKAPTAAAAQVLSHVHVSLYQRPQAELATFRHIDLLTSSYPLTRELARSAAAAVIAELLLTFCPPGEELERSYRLGVACLEALLTDAHPGTVVSYAQFWSLVLGGVFSPSESNGDSLKSRDLEVLSTYRKRAISEISQPVPTQTSRWLDRRVREEAERPLRALGFFRENMD